MSGGKWLGRHDVRIIGAAKGNRPAEKIFDHGPKKAWWVTTMSQLSFFVIPEDARSFDKNLAESIESIDTC